MTLSTFKIDACSRSSSTICTNATLHLHGRGVSYLASKGRSHPSKRLRPSFLSSIHRISRCSREHRPPQRLALVCSLSEDASRPTSGSPSTDWADGDVDRLGNGWGGQLAVGAEHGHMSSSHGPGATTDFNAASAHDQANGGNAPASPDGAASSVDAATVAGAAGTASSAHASASPSATKERRASGVPPGRRKQDGTFLGNTLALLLAGGCALALAGSGAIRGGAPATGTIASGSGADSYTAVAATASTSSGSVPLPPGVTSASDAGPIRTARRIAKLWANRPKIGLNAVIPDEVLAQGENALRTIKRKLVEPGRVAAMKKLPKSPSVAPDALQVELLAAMQSAGVVEPGVLGHDMCLKRQYARWLLTSSTKLYRGQLTQRVLPATLATALSDVRAFDDVPPTDPDYESIQGLAEAGIFPSRLTVALPAYDKSSAAKPRAPQPKRPVFNPDQPLSREELLRWKAALEHQRLPVASADAVRQKLGFLDAGNLSDSLLADLLVDIAYGDKSVVTRAFGYTRLFNPNKSVTIFQASSALASGKAAQMLAAADGTVTSTSATSSPAATASASNNASHSSKNWTATSAPTSAGGDGLGSASASSNKSKSSQTVGDVASVPNPATATEAPPSSANPSPPSASSSSSVDATNWAGGSGEQRARDAATGTDAGRKDAGQGTAGSSNNSNAATRLHVFTEPPHPDPKTGTISTDVGAASKDSGGYASKDGRGFSKGENLTHAGLSQQYPPAPPPAGLASNATSSPLASSPAAAGVIAGSASAKANVDPTAAVATPLAAAAAFMAGTKTPAPVASSATAAAAPSPATPSTRTATPVSPSAAAPSALEGSVGATNRASSSTAAPAGKEVARPADTASVNAPEAARRKQHHAPPVPPVVKMAAQASAVNAIAPVVPEVLPQPSLAHRILDHIKSMATPSTLPLPPKEAPVPKPEAVAAQAPSEVAVGAGSSTGPGVAPAPAVSPAQASSQGDSPASLPAQDAATGVVKIVTPRADAPLPAQSQPTRNKLASEAGQSATASQKKWVPQSPGNRITAAAKGAQEGNPASK